MNHRYQTLISPFVLPNGVVLRTRMVHPKCAPDQNQGPEDFPTEMFIHFHREMARRGNALVIADIRDTPGVRQMPDTHDFAHSYTFDTKNPAVQNYICQLADDVHFYGSKVLAMCMPVWPRGKNLGGKSPRFRQEARGFVPAPPMEMATKEEIRAAIDEAVARALKFKSWGYDGIAVHIYNDLNADMNIRTDEYGGSTENRCRMMMELFDAVKKACGRKFIVHAMLNGVPVEADRRPEDVSPGYTLDDVVTFCKLAEGRCDVITVRELNITESHPTGYTFRKEQHRCINMIRYLKDAGVSIPLAAAGAFQDPGEMERLLSSGACDLISIGRGQFTDKDYFEKILAEKGEEIRPCIRCNRCHGRRRAPWTSVCTVNPEFGCELKDTHMVQPVTAVRKVAVIGGGPAGMQAAITAAERGHKVTLFEKTGYLGGQLFHADYFSFKWPFRDYRLWLIAEMERKGVEVKLNCEPTPEELSAAGYDAVLAATGSEAVLPAVEGMHKPDGSPALKTCHDVIGREAELGKNVIMVGCSETGIETACYLAQHGHNVTCLTRQDMLAKDASPLHSITIAYVKPCHPMTGESYLAHYWERFDNIRGITHANTVKVTAKTVTYVDAEGAEHTLEGDDVVVCGGVRPRLEDALKYASAAPYFRLIGDVDDAGDMQKSIRSAFGAASQL